MSLPPAAYALCYVVGNITQKHYTNMLLLLLCPTRVSVTIFFGLMGRLGSAFTQCTYAHALYVAAEAVRSTSKYIFC